MTLTRKRSGEERQDALDSALERMRSDDDLPTYDARQQHNNADYEEIVYGDTTSFIDKLNEQVGERVLTERQKRYWNISLAASTTMVCYEKTWTQ